MAIFDFVRVRQIDVTPVVSTSPAYSALDQVGNLMKFGSVTLNQSGASFLLGWQVYDKKQIEAALALLIFDRSVTVSADNAAFAITDADAAHMIPGGYLLTGTYVKNAATSSFYTTTLTAPIPLKPFSGKSIYVAMRAIATPTYTGVDDIIVSLMVGQMGAGV